MNKKGGIGKIFTSIIWILLILGVMLAISQQVGVISIEDGMDKVYATAAHYADCIPAGECGLLAVIEDIKPSELIVNPGDIIIPDNITGKDFIMNLNSEESMLPRDTKGYSGPANDEAYVTNLGTIKKTVAKEILDNIKDINEELDEETDIKYNRSEWKHWINTGRPCWNTREEILFRDAKPNSIIFLNKKLEPTLLQEEACAIGTIEEIKGKRVINTENSGEWIDPYNGKIITSPSEINIDHIVPLSYANKRGGQYWSIEKKQEFANDLDNLLATSVKENMRKAGKGPDKYMPTASYKCQYAKTFTAIVYKYDLKITESERKVLEKSLRICQY